MDQRPRAVRAGAARSAVCKRAKSIRVDCWRQRSRAPVTLANRRYREASWSPHAPLRHRLSTAWRRPRPRRGPGGQARSMSLFTAVPTRVPGLVLVVVLSLVPALVPAPALGTPGDADPVGVWPLRPRPEVVAGFDPPLDPWGSGHRGVDLLGSVGQPVRAALPGRVTFAGVLAGRGVVVVSHGDTRTTYEPVTADVVRGRDRGGRWASRAAGGVRLALLPACLPPLGLVARRDLSRPARPGRRRPRPAAPPLARRASAVTRSAAH